MGRARPEPPEGARSPPSANAAPPRPAQTDAGVDRHRGLVRGVAAVAVKLRRVAAPPPSSRLPALLLETRQGGTSSTGTRREALARPAAVHVYEVKAAVRAAAVVEIERVVVVAGAVKLRVF